MSHSSSSSTSDEGRGRRSPKKRKAKKDKKGCNKKRRDKRSAPKRLDQDYLRVGGEISGIVLKASRLPPQPATCSEGAIACLVAKGTAR